MKSLWFEIPVQLAVIAALTVAVFRDAEKRRERYGSAPGGVSARTWAGLCGLLWVPIVYYAAQRKRQDRADIQVGAAIKHGWWLIAVGVAIAWLAGDIQAARTPSIIEHSLYLVLVLAGWAWATAGAAVPTPSAATRYRA